jgi:DNA-binding transcriptional ArsR family regulator
VIRIIHFSHNRDLRIVRNVNGDADLESIGALLADKTRVTIMSTLLNGGLTAASVLADRAGVSRPLASNHLKKLTNGGLIVAEPRGRQRLYRLRSQSVAEALEALIQIAPPRATSTLAESNEGQSLRHGRLCYDHLAGRLGVALADGLCAAGFLSIAEIDYFVVTPSGAAAFGDLGIDVVQLSASPRPLTRACADWSEQRQHLAGSLGGALSAELLRRGWVIGREASRVVDVSPEGVEALTTRLGVDPAALVRAPDGMAAA